MALISKIKGTNGTEYNVRDDVSVWGGRNLIKNSNIAQLTTSASAWGYSTWRLAKPDSLKVGETLVASAKITPGASDTWTAATFYLYNAAQDDGARAKSATVLGEIVNNYAFAKLTVNSNYTNYTDLLIYYGTAGQCTGHSGTITDVKLERGTKPTDWSPAPEDIAHVNGECLELLS